MLTRISLVVAMLAFGLLAACDKDTSSLREAAERSPGSATSRYQSADSLIADLNSHLEDAGQTACEISHNRLTNSYTTKVSAVDAAACRFKDGPTLYALIVDDGEDVYSHFFADSQGPSVYLRGPTWIVITSSDAPSGALAWFRKTLGAAG